MTPAQKDAWQVSWEALQGRAWWYLSHSSVLPPSVSHGRPFHGLPRLRMWDDAMGFGCQTEPTSLTVYELFGVRGHRDREPVVREAVWRRTDDLRHAHDEATRSGEPALLRPTITVRDAAVPAEPLAALLAEAATFQLPLVWFGDTESVTSDVGQSGFEFFSRDQPTASLKLEWSYVTPPEWQPAMDWCGRLWRLLTGCL